MVTKAKLAIAAGVIAAGAGGFFLVRAYRRRRPANVTLTIFDPATPPPDGSVTLGRVTNTRTGQTSSQGANLFP